MANEKIQFRKEGTSTWVDTYSDYQGLSNTGGTVTYIVKYVFDTSSGYQYGHHNPPAGWSIESHWSSTYGDRVEVEYMITYPASTTASTATALISFFIQNSGQGVAANSLPLAASNNFWVGDESGHTSWNTTIDWNAGGSSTDCRTYIWSTQMEYITNVTTSVDVDWISGVTVDTEDEEIYAYVQVNTGTAARTGTITVTATYDNSDLSVGTSGATIIRTWTVTQKSLDLNPIWKDLYFTGATSTLDYSIRSVEDNTIIYTGRAYIQPNASRVKINVSKIVQNYLDNNIPNGNSLLNPNIHNSQAIKEFELRNSGDTLLSAYTYYYDWSYEDERTGVLTKPINGHADTRMVKLGTESVLQPTTEYYTHSMPALYTSGYCGEYALYYMQRNGGWAAFLIEGNAKKTDSYQKYSYNMSFDNTKAEYEENTYHNEITAKWELKTGWLTDEQSQNLAFNLIPSNRVFLHDLKADKIIPVVMTNDSAEYKTFKNTGRQLVRYDLTLNESQKKQML